MRCYLAVIALIACSAWPAAAQSPEDMIRWVYTSLAGPGALSQQGLPYMLSPAQRRNYFTRRMLAFFDANDSYGGGLAQACVDFSFAVPGNDYNANEIVQSLRISSQQDATRKSVVADFVTFGQPARVVYDFVPEDGYWKIDDIAGEGFRVSQIPCAPKTAAATPDAAQAKAYCFKNGNDDLRLDLGQNGTAQLEFSSWQSNGHSCSGRMPGQQVSGGWNFPAEQGCILQLRITADGGVRMADTDHACKFMMCGQRAVIDGLSFPHSTRVDCAKWQGIGN